jgi:hypothetical protein
MFRSIYSIYLIQIPRGIFLIENQRLWSSESAIAPKLINRENREELELKI